MPPFDTGPTKSVVKKVLRGPLPAIVDDLDNLIDKIKNDTFYRHSDGNLPLKSAVRFLKYLKDNPYGPIKPKVWRVDHKHIASYRVDEHRNLWIRKRAHRNNLRVTPGSISLANRKLSQGDIIFTDGDKSRKFVPNRNHNVIIEEDALVLKNMNGSLVLNSSSLSLSPGQGVKTIYGGSGARWQRSLDFFPALPFNLFTEQNLDVNDVEIIDRGEPESISVRRYNDSIQKRHFTGYILFRVADKYHLLDIDRNEVEHQIFSPFVVNLPGPCNTREEAYESLIPEKVKIAKRFNRPVLRQGEWFFIGYKDIKEESMTHLENRRLNYHMRTRVYALRTNSGRPHYVTSAYHKDADRFDIYVKGVVSHAGREHKALRLDPEMFWKPVPNTSIGSWSITGDID